MEEVNADFHNALVVCGVVYEELMNAITVTQGVAHVELFMALTVKELDSLAVAINKMRPPEGQDPVVLNQIVLKRMKALRMWLLWREQRGMEMDLVDFDADELQWGLDRMSFEARFKDAEPPEQLLPEKLKSIGFDVWQVFWQQLTTYCGTICGAMAIPISYVFREHDVPTEDMIMEVYADSDEELMATVSLAGPDNQHDNKLVWNILARLVGSGNAWPFIKHLASTFDARAAIKILKTQSQGSASDSSRRARANGILKTTFYTGKSNKFSFDAFVEKLQYALTELEETGAGQTEAQKVNKLIDNVSSSLLQTAFPTLINDEKLEHDFGWACAFLSNYLTKVHSIDPTGKTSTVASTTTAEAVDRSYTDEEWKAHPKAVKKAITRKRQCKNKKKRQAAAVQNGSSTTEANTTQAATSYKKKLAKKVKLNKEIAAMESKHGFSDDASYDSEETVTVGNR
jgi:hypothetical protein